MQLFFSSNSLSEQQAKYCLSKMDFAKMGAISATLIRARFAASIAGIPRESSLVRLRPEYWQKTYLVKFR